MVFAFDQYNKSAMHHWGHHIIRITHHPLTWVMICLVIIAGLGVWWMIEKTVQVSSTTEAPFMLEQEGITVFSPVPIHISRPQEVRGLYWTIVTAGNTRSDELLSYMLSLGLNAVVVDLKMDNGWLGFSPNEESLQVYVSHISVIEDLDARLTHWGEQGVYRIARIAVMRDGALATARPDLALFTDNGSLWQDAIGSLWVDPAAIEVAEYAINLGREAYERGFDEIQFDYVRFPSDGTISSALYPIYNGLEDKNEIMGHFFERVGGTLRAEGIPVSFDVFGMICLREDGFGIGQRLVDVLPFTDFLSPMVYPSHYPEGFEGFANPALYPYEVVKDSLDACITQAVAQGLGTQEEMAEKFRPWLQDFDIGAVYTANLIEAQIQASRDAGASGWMLWNSRNVYEPAEYEEE